MKENVYGVEDLNELSSFEYMPKYFLGIKTKDFATSRIELNESTLLPEIHPFLKLKEKSMNSSINMSDRMQCIRYMCRIPYIDNINHCYDGSTTIISDESQEEYDMYKRYYFFANNDKYFKLEDNLVYKLQPYFYYFSTHKKYPLELILLSARYIIMSYPYDSDERVDVLNYLLEIADDKKETVYARAECADILYTYGEGNEIYYGKKIITELGIDENQERKTVYTNMQNVHNEKITESVIKIIRTLKREFHSILGKLFTEKYTIDNVRNDLNEIISKKFSTIQPSLNSDTNLSEMEKKRENVNKFLFRIMTDPSRYEQMSIAEIMLLVYYKIKKLDEEKINVCIQRLLEESEESLETCSSGYLTRIINVLSGFVEGEDMQLRLDPKDELRSAIFARIHQRIRSLPDVLRNDVLEGLTSDKEEDKQYFDQFMDYYSPEEELWNEYKDIMIESEFKEVFIKSVNEYKGM